MIRFAIIFVSILAGLGAGGLGYIASQQEPVQAAVISYETPKVDVLAPRNDLLRGTELDEGAFMWAPWPEDQVRPGMVLKSDRPEAMSEFSGRHLRSNVYAQEPLREQHLSDGEGGYLALALQPGKRAIGVSVGATKTAGGFIMPNDRVDVLLTVVRDLDGDGSASGATRTILTNVRILAIGGTTMDKRKAKPKKKQDDDTGAKKPPVLVGKTATLEVSAKQAEVLLAASAPGSLSLALRAAEDFGLSGVGDLAMIESSAPLAPSPVPAPSVAANASPQVSKREVTIISGGSARIFTSASPQEEKTDD